MVQYLQNIAIVGASGNLGFNITEALLKSPRKQNITAITRAESKAVFPKGVNVKTADYNNVDSIAEALAGQEALIITLSFKAEEETQTRLIEAAGKAGVAWILPNEYGSDNANEKFAEAVPINAHKKKWRDQIEKSGKSSFIAMTTGPWFEYNFTMGGYGINIKERTASFYGDGNTLFNISTMANAGRGVAGLLALPVTSSNGEPSISDYKNGFVYVSSFTASQKDLVKSLQRVTGTKDTDWKLSSRDIDQSIQSGHERFANGDMMGVMDVLFGNVCKPGMGGNFEESRGLDNQKLGLPKEDLDIEMKRLVENVDSYPSGI